MRLRERLEIRAIAEQRYGAHAGQQVQLQLVADAAGENAVLDWLRTGVPTPRLDVAVLADLLAAGVTVERYRGLVLG
jgi:hypothetical protein